MPRNGLQDGDLTSVATGTIGALLSGTNTQVVVRSNMTPDITISLASLLSPPTEGAPKAISSPDESKLQFIKPELELRAAGSTISTYSPYGSPNRQAFVYFAIILIIVALMGAKISWTMCRSLTKH